MKKSGLFLTVKIGTVVSAMIAIGILTAQKVMEWWILRQISEPVSEGAGAIGIIGGADGPTSIFVSSSNAWGSPYLWAGGFAVLALAGFLTMLILRKRKK